MLVTVHDEAVRRRYQAPVCSIPFCFTLVTLVAAIVVPFYVAFASKNFWIKVNDFSEQPSIDFKYDMVFLAHGFVHDDGVQKPQSWAWATKVQTREAYESHLRTPVVRAWPEDKNRDGLQDVWHVSLEMPLFPGEAVHAVQAGILFDYSLTGPALLSMDGLAFVDYSNAIPGRELAVHAEAVLHQRGPLSVRRRNAVAGLRFDSNAGASLPGMVSTYADRNFTMVLQNERKVWSALNSQDIYAEVGSSFKFHFKMYVPSSKVEYTPDVVEVLKVAWIQYLSIAVLFYAMLESVKRFVFSNQVLETRVSSEGTTQHSRALKPHRF